MAKYDARNNVRKRISPWLMAGLLFTSVGCGFPHDRYASDAMLGSFNRPIAPTPPIFTGGDPGISPAGDGGVRLGLPSPDVSARSNPTLERMFIMPTYSGSISLNLFKSNSVGGTGGGESTGAGHRSANVSAGARLIAPPAAVAERPAAPAQNAVASANAVTPRPYDSHSILTSGAAIAPVLGTPKPLSPLDSMKDPRAILSVEEGQSVLQSCGAKAIMLNQQPTGEWSYSCQMGSGIDARRYESRAGDQLEAVRAVLYQVKNDR
ncbi:MAG: hypothetical protein K8T89_26365 [Planctomycetes bacterium]|nr:hypothetical protein [Planctomycetota bacterium]